MLAIRTMQGQLAPADDEAAELLRKIRLGTTVRVKVTKMRNGLFFRKWFSLVRLAFDQWSETMPAQEYRGRPVLPNFEKFRKDVTIMAGHWHPVWSARGELRVEADSIAWANMEEETFEKLYSATIDAILRNILPNAGLTEDKLREMVETVVGYA